MRSRATHLEQGIRELLHDPRATGLAKALYNHPMVSVLYRGNYEPIDTFKGWWPTALTRNKRMPSYIPSRNFALALMDMAVRGPVVDAGSSHAGSGTISIEQLRNNIGRLGSPSVQRVLLTALDSAQGDLEKVQKNIEAWYDASMDRVSGWYKRSTQVILFFIGMSVALALNINTLTVANYLYRDKTARDALVAQAQDAVANPLAAQGTYEQVQSKLDALKLPIGWQDGAWASLPQKRGAGGGPGPATVDWWQVITGLLVTAFAATFGAPFWFDLLNKVIVLRSTVKPHEKSPEEASEDRQPKKPQADTTAADEKVTAPPQQTAAQPPPPQPPAHPDDIDACDVQFVDFTPDEDLPAAQGGVA